MERLFLLRKPLYLLMLAFTILLQGCIGTDVVEDVLVEEQVSISTRLQSLAVGESFQFSADYFNNMGMLEMADIQWSSSDANVISISDNGEAEAIMNGEATITAMFMGKMDQITVTAGTETMQAPNQRSGRFSGANNYSVNGGFTLEESDDRLTLTFMDDFSASSGPGLFIYLSNNNRNITGGYEVGRIQRNSGTQTYEIDINDVGLNTYDYVLVWCKPFGVLFGVGEIQD